MSVSRRPRPAAQSTALPSLGAALTAAAAQGCEAPACGETRADEVVAHGPQAVRAIVTWRGEVAVHEVAIALGLLGHRSTRPQGPDMTPAGAAPVRGPEPIAAPGEAAEVTTAPVLPRDVDGGVREVRPTPPMPPHPPAPQAIPRPSGAAPSVHPHPSTPAESP